VVFVADDLAGWLVGLLADAGRKKLVTLVLGSDQERALRQAAAAAIESTAGQLAPPGGEQAEQLALVAGEVFGEPVPGAALAGQVTLLQALQAGITAQLAVLDDATLTGTGQSSAEALGVSGGVVAEALAGHLVQEIMIRGSRGGPLAPLADQLNHDVTHLQGQRIEGALAQLADQVTALAGAGSTAVVAGKPVRLLPRPVFLAGREDVLADLDARLTGGGPGPQTVVLSGLGGTGKTSVAVEYAHRHLAEVGLAWQFATEDSAVLAAGFGELAAQLGARDLLDIRDAVASVHGVLAASPTGWLLVFDNVPDRASVQAFLPPAGRGRVLITSRSALWPPGQTLDVPVLDREVAAGFLSDRTGDADQQAALDLAGELGGLPLALEQAAAYIQVSLGSLAGYLASFRQRRPEMLARGEPTGYDSTVAAAWSLAFGQLERSAPVAAGLLRLLACCAPEAVPLRLLLQPRPGLAERLGAEVAPVLVPLLDDPLAAGDAIAELRRYSLVSPSTKGLVSVHRLVQAVTIDQMSEVLAEAWRQATAAVIDAAIPEDPQQPDNWPAFAVLLPHVQATLADGTDHMERMIHYLHSMGSYAAARELQQKIAAARGRVLGPEHPDTLTARDRLASWTGHAGDAAGARDQYAALLPIRKRVLGPEHPDTLATRGNLAAWTGQAGDAAGARDQCAALLPVMERVSGPEHPHTLTVRGYLAEWTGKAGDAAGARDQYAALLPIRERVSGPEHPATLTTRGNLASLTGEAGDAAGARDQFAALLPIRKRVLGPEHPDTLAARGNLAAWTGDAGDAVKARRELAAVLPVVERVLGSEHPETLTTRGNFAEWTGKAGDAVKARREFAALLPIRERVSGPEHPDTLAARANLARWTGYAGDAAGARDQYAALLPVMERVLRVRHPATLAARGDLAGWTGQAGDAAGARDQYAALLPIYARVLGPGHPDTLSTRGSVAFWARLAGTARAPWVQ
jgi:hypothetical protein